MKNTYIHIMTLLFLIVSFNTQAQCPLAKYHISNKSVLSFDYSTFDLHAGDFNKDGFPDILIESSGGPMYFLNTTKKKGDTITFSASSAKVYTHSNTNSNSCNTADLNNDSLSDVVEMFGDTIFIFRDSLAGTSVHFNLDATLLSLALDTNNIIGGNSNSLLIADVNHDGLPDIIADNRYGKAIVFLNTTTGKGKHLSFKAADTIIYSQTHPKKSGYTYFEAGTVADLNADELPELIFLFNDSIITFQNISKGSTVKFNRLKAVRLPFSESASGNILMNISSIDVDRDGYPDVMTQYTRSSLNDSNFLFFLHHKPNNTSITWDSIYTVRVKYPGSRHPDLTTCYLQSYGCSKPDLIVTYDNAESGGQNTFSYYANTSTPGNISFDTTACIITSVHTDMVIGNDFNKDSLMDYITYSDGTYFSILTDTSGIKTPWRLLLHGKLHVTNGSTYTYSITNNIGGRFYWVVSGGKIISGQGTDSVQIKWTSRGIDTIKIINTCSDTFGIITIVYSSTNDLMGNDHFINIYPNPNSGTFTLHYLGDDSKPVTLEVIDILGQRILQKKLMPYNKDINEVIDISNIRAGTYLVRLTANDKVIVQHITVIK